MSLNRFRPWEFKSTLAIIMLWKKFKVSWVENMNHLRLQKPRLISPVSSHPGGSPMIEKAWDSYECKHGMGSSPSSPSRIWKNPAPAKRIIFNSRATCVLRRTPPKGHRQILRPAAQVIKENVALSESKVKDGVRILSTWQGYLYIWELDSGFMLTTCERTTWDTPNTTTQASRLIPQGVPPRNRLCPFQFCWGMSG